jgi:AcrR family transcriptional regulator
MAKDTYHHGTLKEEMINKGLELLNKKGFEEFSLRKVASMCGVSHTAPYKHFKDKEELLKAISLEVSQAFKEALLQAVEHYPKEPKAQLIDMGKCYVKFMVENPEYLKFLFLTEHKDQTILKKDEIGHEEKTSFDVFKESAKFYLTSINIDEELHNLRTIAMWSIVHGISLLFANKVISCEEDYLEFVQKMLEDSIFQQYR